MKNLIAIIVFCIITGSAHSQNVKWYNFMKDQNIHSMVFENEYLWATSSYGLIKINETEGVNRVYHQYNSGLP